MSLILSGSIRLNINTTAGQLRWQMISVHVVGKKVKEYVLDQLDTKIKVYDASKSVNDVVERVSAFPGHLDRFLTFIPGSTPSTNEGNFNLVMDDNSVLEITGFWIGIKDYSVITGGDILEIDWNMAD